MSKKCAILQPNYIPWKGVFDLINQVDVFVFLDDVQFTKTDWRTRNKIKTPNDTLWLSVPVKKTNLSTTINEVTISDDPRHFKWQEKHYRSIVQYCGKAPFFKQYDSLLEDIYLRNKWDNLSEMNIYITKLLCSVLGINTKFFTSSEMNIEGTRDDRLINICRSLDCDFYLSGPSARNYINNEKFANSHVTLAYINYDYYRKYEQSYGDFNHFVSVLDVIFHCGNDAPNYIFSGRYDIEVP
jgi:hypothetical protein